MDTALSLMQLIGRMMAHSCCGTWSRNAVSGTDWILHLKITEPLILGEFESLSVRYFRSPLYEKFRQPDMPWHAIDDLHPALLPSTEAAVHLKRALRTDWYEPKTVATSEGLVTIAPHFMAEGLFEAIEGTEFQPPNFHRLRGRYRYFCTQAMKEMTAHLSGIGKLAFALTAMNQDTG